MGALISSAQRVAENMFDQALSSGSNYPRELAERFIEGDAASAPEIPLGTPSQMKSLVESRSTELGTELMMRLLAVAEQRVTELAGQKGSKARELMEYERLTGVIKNELQIRAQDPDGWGDADLSKFSF